MKVVVVLTLISLLLLQVRPVLSERICYLPATAKYLTKAAVTTAAYFGGKKVLNQMGFKNLLSKDSIASNIQKTYKENVPKDSVFSTLQKTGAKETVSFGVSYSLGDYVAEMAYPESLGYYITLDCVEE